VEPGAEIAERRVGTVRLRAETAGARAARRAGAGMG
jgi:hypothetical protein